MVTRMLPLLLLIFCLCVVNTSLSVNGDHFTTVKPKRCLRHRAYGMVASDCYGRNFQSVPDHITSDVQALDLSFNRIRDLDRDSFSQFTSLELLFLDENMISYIANDTFEPLQDLEVVLLRLNAISQVPTSLFKLPRLRKLDLSENRLQMNGLKTFATAPISNQLKWLSLFTCYLRQLPPLQNFARLEYLNVSNNPLDRLDARELAPLCSLKTLDLGASYTLLSHCDCLLLAQWAANRGIKVFPPETLDCANSESMDKTCSTSNHTLQAQRLEKQCHRVLADQQQYAYMSRVWLYVGIAVLACLGIVFIIVIWIMCRRRSRKRRVTNNNSRGKPTTDASNATLLPTSNMQNGIGATQTGDRPLLS